MIDLHCHLLWGMDDGSETFEDTVTLCKLAVENQIDTIVLTPHMTTPDDIDDFLYYRDKKAKELRSFVEAEHLDLRILTGAEVFLSERIFGADALSDLAIAGTDYVLCEYSIPAFSPHQALLQAQEIFEQNLTPIIAHPERYATSYTHPQFLEELQDMGALFQVNAPSLAGKYGVEVQALATALLLSGTADFIATDAHRPKWRDNRFCAFQKDFPKEITPTLLKWATETAPRLVLENRDVQAEKEKLF